MAKRKLLLLGVLVSLAGPRTAPQASTAPSGIKAYEEQEFIADFTKFKIGDTAPAQYQTPEYTIKQYQLRNLPAPDAGTLDLHGRELCSDWRCRWQNLQSL